LSVKLLEWLNPVRSYLISLKACNDKFDSLILSLMLLGFSTLVITLREPEPIPGLG
jgi:hypothetical protein